MSRQPDVPHGISDQISERDRARQQREVVIGAAPLRLADVVAVARHGARVSLADGARDRVARSRAVVDRLLVAKAKVYGVTTGFGPKRDVLIDGHELEALQRNLVRSHACGTGAALAEDAVRALVLLRAATLAEGNSGLRAVVVDRLCDLLNADVYPWIPSRGSVGASGDLAQLSHLALVLMGELEGRVYDPTSDEVSQAPGRSGRRGLIDAPRPDGFSACNPQLLADRFGVQPVRLQAKEGLALINGTQGMAAISCLALWDARETLLASELACALSLEGQQGVRDAFDPRIHAARPQRGQADSAWVIRTATEDSEVLALPLNLPRLDRSIRHLVDAGEHLRQHSLTPEDSELGRLDDLCERVGLLADRLRAIRGEPLRVMREVAVSAGHAPSSGTSFHEAAARSVRPDLLRALRRHFEPLERELLGCYQMTLGSALPAGAERSREFLARSIGELAEAVPDTPPVQDDYSFRCAPQVLGAVRASLDHVGEILETEFRSVTDNPLVFPPEPRGQAEIDDPEAYAAGLDLAACRDAVVSGGNFHGEPLAFAADLLTIVLVEVASISERRVAHLTDERSSNGLPSLLVERAGLRSGFLIPQYTAAALVSEAKSLAHPASVDSIPTGEGSEDHVSMGLGAAHKATTVLDLVERVVAIEMLTATAAVRFRGLPGVRLGRVTAPLYERLSPAVPPLDEDRALAFDMERVLGMLRRGELVDAVVAQLTGGVS